jgi:hypothetical protein
MDVTLTLDGDRLEKAIKIAAVRETTLTGMVTA